MIDHKEWLDGIIKDIGKKYSVTTPQFFSDGMKIEKEKLLPWLKKHVFGDRLWTKYKRLRHDEFEIKPFYPDPEDRVSMALIISYLGLLPKTAKKKLYTVNYIADNGTLIEGSSWYDDEEIKVELLYLFRTGRSKITFYKEPEERVNEIVFHLLVERDSFDNMVMLGYLNLEYGR